MKLINLQLFALQKKTNVKDVVLYEDSKVNVPSATISTAKTTTTTPASTKTTTTKATTTSAPKTTTTKTASGSTGAMSSAKNGLASNTMSTYEGSAVNTKNTSGTSATKTISNKGISSPAMSTYEGSTIITTPKASTTVATVPKNTVAKTSANPNGRDAVTGTQTVSVPITVPKAETKTDTQKSDEPIYIQIPDTDTKGVDKGDSGSGSVIAEDILPEQRTPIVIADTSGYPSDGGYGGGSGADAWNFDTSVKGVDKAATDQYTASFVQSEQVRQADSYLQQMLEAIRGGRTSYSDRLDELINQYLARDKFNYDPNTDVLFQNALNSAMQNGQRAMRDTMGQAAGLTGGYGSSYATAVGNNAYNQYLDSAYDNLSDYYGMALNQYQLEGQDMLNGISLVADEDSTEWQRTLDAFNDQYNYWDKLSSNEYNSWNDRQNRLGDILSMQNKDYWSGIDEELKRLEMQNLENYRKDSLALEGRSVAVSEGNLELNKTKYGDQQASAMAEAEAQAKTSALENEAANVYKSRGKDGLHEYLSGLNSSDPLTYSNDVISKIYKSMTGEDYNKYGQSSDSSVTPNKTANEISADKFNSLVDVFDNFYTNFWASGNYDIDSDELQNQVRSAILNAMESDSKYYDSFTDDAIMSIVSRVIEEGNKRRRSSNR